MDYDLVVIGAGAGGLSAARTANWNDKRVALVTDAPPGGDCTFTGCVPSKTLIAASRQGATFREALARVATTVDRIAAAEDEGVLSHEGIEVVSGRGELVDSTTVAVDGRRLTSKRIVLATGGHAAVPPIPGLDQTPHLTNERVFDVRDAPQRMIVLGGGPIGCELAQAFQRLGVDVTLVEAAPRVLPREDPEASTIVAAALEAAGVEVLVDTSVDRVEARGGVVEAHAGGRVLRGEELLVAVGRRPNVEGLGLEAAGVELDERGWIRTDDRLRTTAKTIFAVGDVTGRLALTHAADEMGRLAAGNALRLWPRGRFRTRAIPWATFTDPEVATVGMSEAEAAAVGGRVAYLPMAEMDRAITDGDERGFIKLVAGPRPVLRNLGAGQLLGATIVAPRAGEMIHEVSLAMRTKMFTGRLAQSVHAYPTASYGVQKCAAQFFHEIEGRAARPAEQS